MSLDVFERVKQDGLRDETSLHSFTTIYFFFPRLCLVCRSHVHMIPPGSVITCLRCNIMVHRDCIDNAPNCSSESTNERGKDDKQEVEQQQEQDEEGPGTARIH